MPLVAPSKISPSRDVTVMVRLLVGVAPPREAPGIVIVSFTAYPVPMFVTVTDV